MKQKKLSEMKQGDVFWYDTTDTEYVDVGVGWVPVAQTPIKEQGICLENGSKFYLFKGIDDLKLEGLFTYQSLEDEIGDGPFDVVWNIIDCDFLSVEEEEVLVEHYENMGKEENEN